MKHGLIKIFRWKEKGGGQDPLSIRPCTCGVPTVRPLLVLPYPQYRTAFAKWYGRRLSACCGAGNKVHNKHETKLGLRYRIVQVYAAKLCIWYLISPYYLECTGSVTRYSTCITLYYNNGREWCELTRLVGPGSKFREVRSPAQRQRARWAASHGQVCCVSFHDKKVGFMHCMVPAM